MNFLKRLFTRKKKEEKQTIPFSSSNYPKHVYHKSLRDASKEDYEYAEQKRREKESNWGNDLLNPLNVLSPLSPFNPINQVDDTPNPNTDIEGGDFGGAGAGGSWGNDTTSSSDSSSSYDSGSSFDSGGSSDSSSFDSGSSSSFD